MLGHPAHLEIKRNTKIAFGANKPHKNSLTFTHHKHFVILFIFFFRRGGNT